MVSEGLNCLCVNENDEGVLQIRVEMESGAYSRHWALLRWLQVRERWFVLHQWLLWYFRLKGCSLMMKNGREPPWLLVREEED